VFVTVGTTSFDSLIEQLDDPEVATILEQSGYNRLVIQIGRGDYIPNRLPGIKQQDTDTDQVQQGSGGGIQCSFYRFKPTLEHDMKSADLIISHAGAGSIMESLRLKKPLIVVINESLMDNHQTEIGEAMHAIEVARCTNAANIVRLLVENKNSPIKDKLKKYPEADYDAFPALLDKHIFGLDSKP